MWSSEDFPGAREVPWPELIRARYQFEVDAIVASVVLRAVAQVASTELTERVAEAALEGARFDGERVEAPAERRLGMLETISDWDGDLCPRFRWPPRPPRRDDELGDPMLGFVLDKAASLVQGAGSEQLQKVLGEALQQVGSGRQAA
jgi:hypothetical protein